jgi:hypothetical protein
LFYRAFDPPVFFAIGSAVAVERLLDEAPLPPSVYVHIRPEILRLVSERYQRVTTKMMQRMILREPALADFTGVETMAADDLKELVEPIADTQRWNFSTRKDAARIEVDLPNIHHSTTISLAIGDWLSAIREALS